MFLRACTRLPGASGHSQHAPSCARGIHNSSSSHLPLPRCQRHTFATPSALSAAAATAPPQQPFRSRPFGAASLWHGFWGALGLLSTLAMVAAAVAVLMGPFPWLPTVTAEHVLRLACVMPFISYLAAVQRDSIVQQVSSGIVSGIIMCLVGLQSPGDIHYKWLYKLGSMVGRFSGAFSCMPCAIPSPWLHIAKMQPSCMPRA